MMAYESSAIRLMILILYLIIMLQNKSTAATTLTTLITKKNQTTFTSQDYLRKYSTSKVNQTNSTRAETTINRVPQSQTLAFQLTIQDALPDDARRNSSNQLNEVNSNNNSSSGSSSGVQDVNSGSSKISYNLPTKNKTTIDKGLKRPYDIQYTVGDNNLEKYSPNLLNNLYLLELENIRTKINKQESWSKRENELIKKKIIMNQRNELVRTQHRPPEHWRDPPIKPYGNNIASPDLIGQKYKLKFTTAAPATITTTTEFFKLISSAHSPVGYSNTPPAILQERAGNIITANKLRGSSGYRMRTSRAPMIINYDTTSRAPSTPYPISVASRFKPNLPDDRVLSPAIVVKDDDESKSNTNNGTYYRDDIRDSDSVVRAGNLDSTSSMDSNTGNGDRINDMNNYSLSNTSNDSGNLSSSTSSDSSREINTSLQFDDDQELSPKFSPLTFFNGKKPVTIIRHTKPRLPPIILMPSRIRNPSPPTSSPAQLVRLIAKQKYKYDDKVLSPTLTVVDSDFNRLPPNSTSVHNNKLIVAIRPGRPRSRRPTTTQFPVYNIVAGITPPYPNNPPVMHHTRPPSYDGNFHGLLRPNGSESSSLVTQPPSNWGSPNIKFPAAEPTNLLPEHIDPLPDKFNITVPDSANIVRPNNVPDKIFIDSDEQQIRPPDSVVSSGSHIVSRPNGPTSVNTQDGIMRIRTTRRPSRGSTTQRVSILSANTTVVTANPEQLHEVLSNVIDSHQQDHHHHVSQNSNNNIKPHLWTSVLNYLSQMINSGVATSAFAVLTLIKTIFVALLVMFLPPMALAAAILQVISMG